MSDPKDYTVGWICAITTEYVAAQTFLDEKHDGPENVPTNDSNDYALGKIGKHNTVIAVLPDGEYGTCSAARVASYMLLSFPNIRIGLMVGIGGGAPSQKHDIRLGDVVVSATHDGKGGVFKYDFGKTIQGQEFLPTAFLNQSPEILRTAMNGLRAQYEIDGHQLEEAINKILEKRPRLRKKYKRPGLSNDRLYQSTIVHPADEASCIAVCGDDPSQLISRPERGEEEDNPAIHYGVIASADQLMKDALVRDRLAGEKNVLCFEMEAAGLMNHFPCLVIRGICDYSDSHKNKEWQGYAAMAAAAYAKDLLCRISPTKVEAEKKINDILSSIEKDVNEILVTSQNTNDAVKDLGFEQRREKIERWLSPPNPSENYNKAQHQRQKDSGLWFLKMDAFAEWNKRQNSFLWLHGIHGCGKTVLSSTIIEELERTVPRQSLLYFYFDFSDQKKQTLESMVLSFVNQLYYKHEQTAQQLDSLFSSCKDGCQQPTSESLWKIFLQQVEQGQELWIVLDALDESHTRKELLSWIRDVLRSEKSNVHLLMTSRREQDIESGIMEFARNDDIVPIQSSAIADDIRAYVRTRVGGDNPFKRWQNRPDVQQEIETRLMEKADGMFRWAACQLDALEKCLDFRTLKTALTLLPETLNETYARILRGIPSEHKQNATRILQFLLFSEEPLTIDEVVDAIAVDTEGDQYFDPNDRMPDPREISLYCSSLVVVVPETDYQGKTVDKLQLAHFSVKEYLTSNRLREDIAQDFEEVAANASIATVCLAYLLHLNEIIPIEKIRETFPLAEYSARCWMDHAAIAEGKCRKLQGFVEKLFCHHKNSYRNCYSLHEPDRTDRIWTSHPGSNLASALYYASFGGLVNAVEHLLSQRADVNAQGGKYGNALQAALARGHEKIVELLVEAGADVNAQGGEYGNALQDASARGHEKIVELLVKAGADVNAQGGHYGNALQAASARGYEKIVELLVKADADVNAQGGKYGNALLAASRKGHEKIVELLVEADANVNAKARDYSNALQAASDKGHKKIVELLVGAGADVNAQSLGHYRNALQAASAQSHENIVELLIEAGADVNAQGGTYPNALQDASNRGREKIVELLVKAGADVNRQSGFYGNALQVASFRGHEKVVELLVEADADVNAQGGHYGNALQAASGIGHEKIVELLVEAGADVNAQGGIYGSALQAAAGGHEKIVKRLVKADADINAQGGIYGNALQAASDIGHEKIVELLIEAGADVNAQGGYHGNALRAASRRGHEKIVELLVEAGANVNAPGGDYGNALKAALHEGHEKIAELLVKAGAKR